VRDIRETSEKIQGNLCCTTLADALQLNCLVKNHLASRFYKGLPLYSVIDLQQLAMH